MRDLRQILRALLQQPGFLFTAIASLALGVGAGVSAFSVIDAVRFRALPFKDGDRLVVIGETTSEDGRPATTGVCAGGCPVAYETFANVLKIFPFRTVDLVAGYTSGAKALNVGGEPILLTGGVVSQNVFEMLGVAPMLGRVFTAEDDRLGTTLVTVISADLWTNHLGKDPNIVGHTIKLSDSRYVVIGVMPPGFDHEVGSDFWLPSVPTLDPSTRPSIRSLTVVARLKPGATLAQFNSELGAIDPTLLVKALPTSSAISRLEALPLRARYVASTQSNDLIFAAVVGCVILIAVTNLANLILVRTLHRQRDIAIQAALGAGARWITRRLIAEHLIVVMVATVVGIGLANVILGILRDVAILQSLRPAGMEYRLDARAIGFAALLAAGLAVVLSLVPARLLRRTDIQSVLRLGAPHAGGGGWGRGAQRVFVVLQLAAAVVLLTGATLLTKTVFRLSRLDLGFDSGQLLEGTPSFPHPWRVREKFVPVTQQIVSELSALPGAERVAVRASVPLGPRGATPSIALDGQSSPLPLGVVPSAATAVDTGYFRTLGISVVQGRAFGPADVENGPPVAIVNQWAAERWWPGQSPVGRVIRVDTAPSAPMSVMIVGVVRDNRAAQPGLLLAQQSAELYRPIDQAPSAFPTFLIRARSSVVPLVKPVKETLARLVPDRPLFATPVADRAEQQLSGIRINTYQIIGFAGVGLALAILGIYGVLSYAVGRRTQEIGIRGALGASRGEIGKMVVFDGVRLAALGIAIGLPTAVMAARSLTTILHGTSPADGGVLFVVTAGVLGVAMAASWLPARRAARVDPLVALRSG